MLTKAAPWVGITILARLPGGESQVGVYYAVDRVLEASIFFLMLASSTALPSMAQKVAEKDTEGLGRLSHLTLWLAWMMTMPPAIFAASSERLIMSILGPGFAGRGPVLGIVALGIVAASPCVVFSHVLLALARVWDMAALAAVWAVCVIIISFFFAPLAGAAGVALAVAAAYSILAAMAWLRSARLYPALEAQNRHIASVVLFLLLYVITCLAAQRLTPVPAAMVAAALSACCAGVVWLGADEDDRKALKCLFKPQKSN